MKKYIFTIMAFWCVVSLGLKLYFGVSGPLVDQPIISIFLTACFAGYFGSAALTCWRQHD